ncbi:MAG: GNAT family N-acetyltransferase [Elusimicrobiaceae bacterium]|nr:GNAT family N-acetyltransferase [Elusimicrobiaceae bacterium]
MSQIVIKDAEKDLKTFIHFPYRLYQNNPYWVGELKADTLKLLKPENAFWTHARRKLLLAYKDGEVAGRLCALVNDTYNEYQKENIGFFGFFDAIHDQEVAHALFAEGEKWLRAQGVEAVRGPANPSSNHVYGLLTDSFDAMPSIMMPYNYPYYMELIEKEGFSKVKDLLAFHRSKEDKFSPLFEKIVARAARGKGLTLRRLNLKNLKQEASIIRKIYNDAWAANWGHTPISEQEIQDMVEELKWIVKPEGTCIAEVDGVPAGFYIAIANMNHVLQILRGTLCNPFRTVKALLKWPKIRDARLIMLGIDPNYRKRGIDLVLIKHIVDYGVAIWDEAELSWILEDNDGIIRAMTEAGCRQTKRYRLYQKSL